MDDTIAAISTPFGVGGISLIRISGPKAIAIADEIFQSRHNRRRPSEFRTHTLHFGVVRDNGAVLDQVMLAVMRRPRSYTGEDVVEVSCHGGVLIAQSVLAAILRRGARMAEPGEFTKRAFLNGKLDLSQAEAVIDLITARTMRAQAAALRALDGQLGKAVDSISNRLQATLALVEAHIDFSDEDIPPLDTSAVRSQLAEVLADIRTLLKGATEGQILRHGYRVAIVGRPNVGKSSLLNALLGTDRAIVTAVPGTTRDSLEEYASIRGIPVCLVDTAGMRQPRGAVERLGIERTVRAISEANGVLQVLDASRPLSAEDRRIFETCKHKLIALVLNKIDLARKLKLDSDMNSVVVLEVSVSEQRGLDAVRTRIAEAAGIGDLSPEQQQAVINQRHADALRRAAESLEAVLQDAVGKQPLEVTAHHIRRALNSVGEITGRTAAEEVLERIFSQFCIGK